METQNLLLRKIKEQLETVRGQFNTAQLDLDAIVTGFIDDITENLMVYVFENVRREIRKSPEAADSLEDKQIEALRDEMTGALVPEIERIVGELRGSPLWHEDDTAFLDLNSKIWKSIKSVEEPANEVLSKYGMNPINMKNWAWLSPGIDATITTRFPAAKKEFTDKRKQLTYLENRYKEETRLENVLNKLESL